MKKVVVAGQFNPLNNGQLDLIVSANEVYDEVVVLVYDMDAVKYDVPAEKRAHLVEKALITHLIEGIQVVTCKEGAIAKTVKDLGSKTIIRGLRAMKTPTPKDIRFVERVHEQDEEIDIHYMISDSEIQNEILRTEARWGRTVEQFVPESIRDEVEVLWRED